MVSVLHKNQESSKITQILTTVEPLYNGHLNMGTEESGRCREVLNKSQCMDFLSVAVSGGSTVRHHYIKEN